MAVVLDEARTTQEILPTSLMKQMPHDKIDSIALSMIFIGSPLKGRSSW